MIQFSADAYVNEMGITTQSCFRGAALTAFAVESAPNGVPVSAFCDDRAPRQTGTNPGGGLTATQWSQVDDAVGACAGNRTEIQDDVFLFAVFMTALAPAPRDFSDQISVTRGQPLFAQVGCNNCHVTTTFRTPANPAPVSIDAAGSETVRVPGNFAFNPYSDFAVHDMGTLGDRIGNAGDSRGGDAADADGAAVGHPVPQPPAARRALRRHRRARSRRTTARRAAARNAFNALSQANQHNIVQFVRSL